MWKGDIHVKKRFGYLTLAIFSDLQVVAVAFGAHGRLDGGGLLLAAFFGVIGLVAVGQMLEPTARETEPGLI
jgi:hypothetical protein